MTIVDLKKILDEFKFNKDINYFSIVNSGGGFKVRIVIANVDKITDVYERISEKIFVGGQSNKEIDLIISSHIGEFTADDAKDALKKLKYGKRGFDRRKGWPKNE